MTRKRLTGPCTGAVKDCVSCAIETRPSLSTPSAIGLLRRPPVKALLNPANISECRANFQPLFQLERRLLAIQARPGRGAPDIAAKLTAAGRVPGVPPSDAGQAGRRRSRGRSEEGRVGKEGGSTG